MSNAATNRVNVLNANIERLEADIAKYQAHFDATYDDVLAAEAAGDAAAVAHHDAWLDVFYSMLTSMRANLWLAQCDFNELLVDMEAA